jgi:ribosomal protein S2
MTADEIALAMVALLRHSATCPAAKSTAGVTVAGRFVPGRFANVKCSDTCAYPANATKIAKALTGAPYKLKGETQ